VLRKWFALLSYNLMLYLGNIFWPLHLSPFRPIPQSLSLADVPILLSELGTVALFVLWLTAWRWSKPFVVGLASFILNLALALGALRFVDSCVADRFLYFPFVFLLLCAAAAIGRIESLSDRPVRLLRYAVLLLLVPLTILMRGQQTIWRDSRTFWTHAAETVPENAVAHLNLGLLSLNEQNPADAFKFAQRAMALRPDDAEVVGLMGRVLIEQGKAADAVKFLDGAVSERLYPDAGPAYLAMGEALVANMDLDRARGAAEKAIELGQPATVVYECLGNMALRKTRRFDFAASCYREAVKAAPENLTARWNIGTALEAAGDMSAALSEYEATLSRQAELGRPSPELVAKVESLRQQRRPAASQKPPDRAVEP
jgi:tetratricopeptide (TPR) repeat protein